jgi:hypothetical protein
MSTIFAGCVKNVMLLSLNGKIMRLSSLLHARIYERHDDITEALWG